MARPACGINIPGGNASSTSIVTGVGGAVFTAAGIASSVWGIVKAGSAAAIWAPYAAAVAAAVIIIGIIIYFTVERCNENPKGTRTCMAGVIERMTPAFTGTAWDNVFAFASPHDRVDVVVKQIYWDFIEPRSDYVFCSDDQSPMIPSFFYTPAVCNAGIGATVGATVGAVAGLLIAAAAVGAIGCATWILCILAILVALVLVIAAAILGAVAGGQIGKEATAQPGPSSTGSDLIPPQPFNVGDYVTFKWNVLKSGDLDNALVFYFVTESSIHGRSINSPSFSHTDPDANLQPDACPAPETLIT